MKRVLIILVCLLLAFSTAWADTVFVLCQPDSFVYVRAFPKKGSEMAGYAELGDALETDGITRNGFLLVYGFEGDAWINKGFVTDSPVTIVTLKTQIMSKGRVACRRSINGTRRKWLKNGSEVVIFAFADDWAITDKGFIQTQYLGVF